MKMKWMRLWVLVFAVSAFCCSADWPVLGGDLNSSYSTTEQLTFPLAKHWVYQCDHLPAPAFKNLVGTDAAYAEGTRENTVKMDFVPHVVVSGTSACFSEGIGEQVICLDTASGLTNWIYTTDGTVSVPPSISEGRVYFTADDGCAYCVSLSDGSLVWKADGAPDNSAVLISERMASMYPSKTGVTVEEGIAYFGTGLFPQQGVWLNAVDAATGNSIWQRKIEYSANGIILVDGDRLFLPSGRCAPVEIDKATGSNVVSSSEHVGRRSGGSALLQNLGGMLFFYNEKGAARVRAVDSGVEELTFTGDYTGTPARQFCASDTNLFLLKTVETDDVYSRSIYAFQTNFYEEFVFSSQRDGTFTKVGDRIYSSTFHPEQRFADQLLLGAMESNALWSAAIPSTNDCFVILNAGNHLFGGGEGTVFAYDISTGSNVWQQAVDGDVYGLSVADGALFASTTEGKVYCFRNSPSGGSDRVPAFSNPYSSDALYDEYVDLIVEHADQTNGWCVVLGAGEGNGQLAYEIAQRTPLHIIGFEDDPTKLSAARSALRQAGVYGDRVVLREASGASFPAPKMFANVIVSEETLETGALPSSSSDVLKMLKPYGGLILLGTTSGSLDMTGWDIDGLGAWTNLTGTGASWAMTDRGPLVGGGVWDHHYADLGNTFCTDDQYVGTDLMYQWLGVPGSGDVIDRHYMAMPPLFRNGKLVYSGKYTSLRCLDPYNGTPLWKIDIEGMVRQRLPLVNGFLCMDDDYVYAAATHACHKVDLDSGEVVDVFSIPDSEAGYDWGFIAIKDDLVYGTKIKEEASYNAYFDIDAIVNREIVRPIAAKSLFAESKTNGAVIWNYETNSAIVNMGIAFGGGSIFFSESYHSNVVNDSDGCVDLVDYFAAGEAYVVSLNEDTGEENWRRPIDRSGDEDYIHSLHLLYKDDLLIAVRGNVFTNEAGGSDDVVDYQFEAINAATGETVWTNTISGKFGSPLKGNKNSSHMHPTIVADKIYLNRSNFESYMYIIDLATGTRDDIPYSIQGKACGAKPASAKALFYRHIDMEAFDIETRTRAEINRSSRSSCWASSIPTGGLLMMPEGGAGCICGVAFQLSCAMIPRDSGIAILSSVSSLDVPEGGTAEFGIRLSEQPTNSVTVSVTKESGDEHLTITAGSSLTFTTNNWNTDQTVSLAAATDSDSIEGTATLRCTATNLVSKNVIAREQELAPQNPSVQIDGGAAETLDLEVTLTLSASGPAPDAMIVSTNAGFSGASWEAYATSKPWNFANGLGTKTIYAKFRTNTYESVSVSDTINYARTLIVTNQLTVPEEGTESFWVKLSSEPESNVTLSVTHESGDSDITVQSGSPTDFTSGNWDSGILITLAAADDADWTEGTAQILCSVPGMTAHEITATEAENDVDETYILPWSETFEPNFPMAGTLGTLDGQHGWTATAAAVTNTNPQAGSQACEVGEGGQISHLFTNNATKVNLTLWMKPSTGETNAPIPADAAAVFYVNTNNQVVAYNSTNATVIASPTVSNDWNEITVFCDFISKVWKLSLNGTELFTNFAFYADTQSDFNELRIVNEEGTAEVDSIALTDADSFDQDDDGIADSWEIEHYGSTNVAPDSLASNGINTVLEAYIADLDPTNAAARFLISDLSPLTSESVLTWQGVSGRVYTVYWSSNLLDGFVLVSNNVPWTSSVFTDETHNAGSKGFYKIEVELEE